MSTPTATALRFWNSPDFTTTTPDKFDIKKKIAHGQVLRGPAKQMEGTTRDVAYVLGSCLQLDQTHCLVMVGTEEQDGGDLYVGIPFIDHGMATNVFLEERWRHLIFFRVCDLKERTFHAFQIADGVAEKYTKGGPLSHLLPTSGLYLAEFEYKKVIDAPWKW